MERKDILTELKKQIKELIKLEKECSYNEHILSVKKDLKNVYNCIKKGGNLSDIEKVCTWHFPAYLSIDIPKGISLKQYIKNISNNIESATGVEKHIVFMNYQYSKYKYI